MDLKSKITLIAKVDLEDVIIFIKMADKDECMEERGLMFLPSIERILRPHKVIFSDGLKPNG